AAGMHAMVNLVGSQFAEQFGGAWRANPDDAVTGARVEHLDGRILVRAPETPTLRNVPLAVTIHAPADSGLSGKTSTADITVTGRAGESNVSTGSGTVTMAEPVDTSDRCRVRTGAGHVRLGTVAGGFDAHTSSGAVEVTAVSGSASATTGAGAVWFGEVTGAVFARTGSGSIAVADARSGTAELNTGSGDLRVGIGRGVTSELDVSAGTGRVVSEMEVCIESSPAETA